MTTDASAKPTGRAATRSARERKDTSDVAVTVAAPRDSASDTATSDAPTEAAAKDKADEPIDPAATTNTARRSTRRAVKAVESPPAASESTETDVTAETSAAVAACVASGVSLSVAATRFGISRADVARIVKATTVDKTEGTATKEEAQAEGSEASTESDGSDEESDTASKPSTNTNKRTARDDDTSASSRAAKVAKDATATSVAQSVTTDATAVTPTEAVPSVPATTEVAPVMMTPMADLKRSADVLMSNEPSTPIAGASLSVVPKAKRVRKTREEKLAILAFVDEGGTHVAAAEKFGVSRTAVTKMVKERDIIMSGMSGKQLAAVNGGAQPVAGGTPLPATAVPPVVPGASLPMDTVPTPPARKTRASSASSTASSAAARQQQSGDGAPHPKAKRVRKTNEEKLLILEFVERGGSQGAAAEKFGVSRTAVTKMVKEREAITAQVMSGKSNHRKVLQYQHKLSIIEDMLYKWQVQVENDAPNLKITGDLLQSKAVEFRDKILAEWKGSLEPEVVQSLSDFKASNGWLHRYLQRRNLRTASKREYHRRPSPHGSGTIPATPSDPFNVSILLADISQRLRTVPVQCIWNMDEIALLPKACVAPSENELGGEAAPMDRMTIALMVNAAGEKFKPEVLISDGYLEKLEVLQRAHPNLSITSQHNAWQDTTALALYLHVVSMEAKQREETWFIVMDASPSHMEFAQLVDSAGSFEQGFRFENLVLLFLPLQANTTHQPLHQGVARVFKAAYRQAMLTTIIQKWNDQSKTEGTDAKLPFNVYTQIDATEEIAWLSSAWEAVPAALIRHCWVRNGLLSPAQLAHISQDNSRAVEAELFRSLTDTISLLLEQDSGALAKSLGMTVTSAVESGAPSLLDRVNALISLDDNELTERKIELGTMTPATSQVITETDANGDLRALV